MMPPPPYTSTAQSYSIIPVAAPITAHQANDSNAAMRPPHMYHNVAAPPQYTMPMAPQVRNSKIKFKNDKR